MRCEHGPTTAASGAPSVRYGHGMFPNEPMAQCSTCSMWSYLAAIEGICLACSWDCHIGGSKS